MLAEVKSQLDDHNAGRRLLSDDEKAKAEKKMDIFQRKLETMAGEIDEREIEKMLKREQIRNERLKERRAREYGGGDEL